MGKNRRLTDKGVRKQREVVVGTAREGFSESGRFQVAMHAGGHFSSTDDRHREHHIHLDMALIRHPGEDREAAKKLDKMPRHLQPEYSQYFFTERIPMEPEEIPGLLEREYRKRLRREMRIVTPENYRPLIHVEWREQQNHDDRWRVDKYLVSDATKTFKDKRAHPAGKGKVLMIYYSDKTCTVETGRTVLPVVDFVRRYLIGPNRRVPGMRWCGYGALAGRSVFAPVIDAARRLYVDYNGEQVRFIDLPINEIVMRARAFRAQHRGFDI